MCNPPRKRCRERGALLPLGTDECVALYERVLVRESGDPKLQAVHRLTVDAYSLQSNGYKVSSSPVPKSPEGGEWDA